MDPLTTFALIHGGGGSGWDWHRVAHELEARGHRAVTPDLPTEDPEAGHWDFADAVVRAIGPDQGGDGEVVVVGHSFGGFTAPLVAARRPVAAVVFVAGMIPEPGEAPAEWWRATGHEDLEPPGDDPVATYMHDLPDELLREVLGREREFNARMYSEPWPLEAWPEVPAHALLCREDRFFPAHWLGGLVRERLGVEPVEIPGSHYAPLSRPRETTDALEAVRQTQAL